MRSRRAARIAAGLTGAALAAASPVAAPAQTTDDDVRCLLLGTGYARAAVDENTRRAAAMTSAFFLGRLSGRVADAALTAAVRVQGTGLPGKEAEPIMRACAARAAAAEQKMAAAVSTAQAKK